MPFPRHQSHLAPMPRPTWDRQTAIEMGNKGRLARAERKKLCANIEQSLPALAHELTFSERIKARLRAQVELVLSRIDEEASKAKADGSRLDRLASALERILESERVLDGRPLPGSRRPPREDCPSSKAAPASRPTPTPARPLPPVPPTPEQRASVLQPDQSPQLKAPLLPDSPQPQATPNLLSEPPDM